MTHDEAVRIDELLWTWYRYEERYMPRLGAPRVSPGFQNYQPSAGDTHDSGGDTDDKLEAETAALVEKCVDALPVAHRTAIQMEMRNRRAGVSVWRGARERVQESYEAARCALLPGLRRAGLI